MDAEPLYQTFRPRLFALLIDNLLVFVAVFVFLLPLQNAGAGAQSAAGVALVFAVHAYFVIAHWRFGKTVGKHLTRVRVRDAGTGEGLGLGQSLMRSAPFITASVLDIAINGPNPMDVPASVPPASHALNVALLLFVGAEIAVLLGSERRQSIHDRLAATVVVREDREKAVAEEPPIV
jgi:uncharacterized RDD family membrane protein YckC